ncbi:MAG: DNA-formamidopyrimidine glycosylase family protein, partial [Gaiella sp.]
MPELPEVEAWVRELDPLVRRSSIASARAEHIATLKTFDPPPAALAGRQLAGAERRAKNLLFPVAGEDLTLRIHLMSAGRLRYHAPGGKPPKTSMFRVTFEDGGQLVLTEAGKQRRAGVWLLRRAALEEELDHLGPDALGLAPERLT